MPSRNRITIIALTAMVVIVVFSLLSTKRDVSVEFVKYGSDGRSIVLRLFNATQAKAYFVTEGNSYQFDKSDSHVSELSHSDSPRPFATIRSGEVCNLPLIYVDTNATPQQLVLTSRLEPSHTRAVVRRFLGMAHLKLDYYKTETVCLTLPKFETEAIIGSDMPNANTP